MNIDSFLGNEELKQQLRGQLCSGTLAHSLLICAQEGCGAGFFARLTAADLLSPQDSERSRRILEGADPDCIEVRGEGASGLIRIDRVREVRAEAQETSLLGERRVVLVYGAENLAAPSANALLKILEEPPSGVFFLITARSAAAVLPTIRSRCGCLILQPPPVPVCEEYLRKNGVAPADAARLSAVWDGHIGTALACARPPRSLIFSSAVQVCGCIAQADAYGLMKLFVPYEKDREGLQTLLADTVQILSGCFSGRENGGVPAAAAVAAITFLQQTAARLRANGNARLQLTRLCLQLGS